MQVCRVCSFNVAEISIEQEMTPQNQHKSTKKTSEKENSFLQILDSNFTFNGKKDLLKAVYKIQY